MYTGTVSTDFCFLGGFLSPACINVVFLFLYHCLALSMTIRHKLISNGQPA